MVKWIASLFVGLTLTLAFPKILFAYSNNMDASVVVGQVNFTENSAGISQTKMTGISDAFVDPAGRLIYVNASENRVLIWNKIPTVNGEQADLVLGQVDFVSALANRGATADANTLSGPTMAYSDGQKLFVADNSNRRVLIWNTFPTQNGQSANVVVGQATMSATSAVCGQSGFSSPWGVSAYNGKLIISNQSQDRVLIWNTIPTTNGAPADVVLGQSSFSTCTAATAAQNTIVTPRGVATDQYGRLFVSDSGAARVLIWNTIPTTNNANADVVVGQTNFSGSSASYSASALGSTFARRVYSSGTRLYIPDGSRLLIYNSIPTSNGMAADIVLGQTNFTSSQADGGGSVSAHGLNGAVTAFEFANQLLVGDSSNNRLLIFNNIFSNPRLAINTPNVLTDSRMKITGSVKLSERTRYSLQNLKIQVNGEGYGDVTYKDGGRDDGENSTLYEFFHEFSPWSGNGTSDTWWPNGYTLKFKATNNNTDEDILFYFYPFKLTSASGSTFVFEAPKNHWQKLKDNLKSFEVKYQKSGSGFWSSLETGIGLTDSMFDNLGKISIKTSKLIPTNATSVKIVAVDNWGHEQNSNVINLTASASTSETPKKINQNSFQQKSSPSPLVSIVPDQSSTPTPEVIKEAGFFRIIVNSIKAFFVNLFGGGN